MCRCCATSGAYCPPPSAQHPALHLLPEALDTRSFHAAIASVGWPASGGVSTDPARARPLEFPPFRNKPSNPAHNCVIVPPPVADWLSNNLKKKKKKKKQVVERLRSYVLGWKAYFGKAETPRVWRELDQWIRHRMRAIQLKQWRRGTTAYRELRARGARQDVARMVAGNMRRSRHNSGTPLNGVLDLRWADQLGIPRLC